MTENDSSGLWSASRRLELDRIRLLLRLDFRRRRSCYWRSALLQWQLSLSANWEPSACGHQIALNVASFTYMVPLGICSAAAVRVGHAMGARDAHAAARAGWMAIFFGALFMSCSGLMLFFFAKPIARMYTPEIDVVNAGATLLLVAAVFQLFDGLQVVRPALFGAQATRAFPCWPILLVLGDRSAAGRVPVLQDEDGALGCGLGLCLALVLIGSALLAVWQAVVKNLTVTSSAATGL